MKKKFTHPIRIVAWAVTAFIWISGLSLQAQQEFAADSAVQVRPVATETTASIMERARLAPAWVEHERPEMEYPDRHGLPQNPESPAVAFWSQTDAQPVSPQGQGMLAPQTVGLSFNGYSNPANSGPFPPDNMGAIGPTQYIVAVNGMIRSFNSTTGTADGVLNVTPDVFFAPGMTPLGGGVTSNFTSDPRIRYDRYSARWLMVIIDVPNGTGSVANRAILAVSNTSTISAATTWTFTYFLGQTGAFLDYPTLGMDQNAVYIGGNMFSTSTGSFVRTNGYVINRTNLMGGSPYTVYSFYSLATSSTAGPYTPQGVDNFDPLPTFGYFVGVDVLSYGLLQLRRVSNPAGVATISANISLTVSTTSTPATVPHLGNTGGTNGNLDAVDDRLYAAVIRGGNLWTAQCIYTNSSGVGTASGTRDAVRWYSLTNLSLTPIVWQSGTIYDPAASNPKYYFFPTVMVSGQGHAAFALATAGSADRANAATCGRLGSDGANTTQAVALTSASTTAYNPTGDPGGTGGRRWGDYSYVSLDPKDDMTMWMVNQYCAGTNQYGSYVTKLIAPPPATPASCSPAMVTAGQASVSVTLTGTSVTGSGFYDPGGNLPAPAIAFNHIAATLTNGVTVNSVTYTDATHITLNLNTMAATGGYANITVTNPDGQALTGTSLLKVCPIIAVQNPGVASGTAGAYFSRSFTSTGGIGAMTYTTASTLPSGLSLSASGVLSGVPAQTGTFPIVVTATDANGCTGSGTTYTLVISCPILTPVAMPGGSTAICPGGSVTLTSSAGNALQTSAGNYVTLPSTLNSGFSANRITVEGWFNLSSVAFGLAGLVSEAYMGDGLVKFSLYLNGQQIIAGFYNGSWTTATSSVIMPVNTWTHIAATYDQTSINVYVNGNLTGSTPATVALPAGSEEWRMGRRWDNPEYFLGMMDEVRIWNVARTQAQIQASKGAIIAPSTSGLLAYYRFDESAGTNTADLTGHNYTGTFTGTPAWVNASTAPFAGYSSYLWSNGSTGSSLSATTAGNYSVTVTDLYGCTGSSAAVAVTLKPLPGAASAITGPLVTAQGHSGIAYSVPAIANATGYVWSLPSGASIATGAGTASITVNFSASATSGNITVYGTNDCGNGPVSEPLAVTVIPSVSTLGTTVIGTGTTICYNAMQTIYIAGGGTTFTVNNGGSATMVAGQNILYQVGTSAMPGSYMHGYITTSNQFCGGQTPAMVTVVTGTEPVTAETALSSSLKVYPNPTTGEFTVEFTGSQRSGEARIEIYSSGGNRVFSETRNGEGKYTVSVASLPAGLYFLRIASGGETGMVKLVKL